MNALVQYLYLDGQRVRVSSSSLSTINGRTGRIVRQTEGNTPPLPMYLVEIDGLSIGPWKLYESEIAPAGSAS